MRPWSQMREDLLNGILLLRKGLITSAARGSQEVERIKLRARMHEADSLLAEAYRDLGKHGLMRLSTHPKELDQDREWQRLIEEVDLRQAERDRLAAEEKNLYSS
ncbi:MAG TPA: hypothetical protein VI702_02365 [Nitrospiria bacterium]